MRAMRTLLVGFIVIFAALVFAALPILFTGKTMLYTVAAGHPMVSQRATTIAAAVAAAFALLWILLHAAAHRFPRKYYQLIGYSRYSIWIAFASLAWAAASVVWRQLVYGVGA
jgi:hypothetical protein